MNVSSSVLIHKLDDFIRRYYKNQLIRGALYFAIAVLVSFLILVLLEYFGRYNSTIRAVFFYSFLLFSSYCLIRFVVMPLAKMYKIGQTLNHEQAAKIIGAHFPDVADKLQNTLQLRSTMADLAENELLLAAIQQKTQQLSPIPFSYAIDLNKNLRYIKFVALPLLLYAVIYIISPGMISDGTKRLVKYNETFRPQAPFRFIIENTSLSADQFEDFTLNIRLDGSQLPDEVFLQRSGNSYKMLKSDNTHFSYTIPAIKESETITCLANEFESDEYKIDVANKARLISYSVYIHYPEYVGRKDETLNSPGDITVPAGSELTWKFTTQQAEEVVLGFQGNALKAEQTQTQRFRLKKKLFLSTPYFIKTQNGETTKGDSLQYTIHVIPDAYPTISVEEKTDTITEKNIYFIGDAADDYGVSKLLFQYRFVKSPNAHKTQQGIVSRPVSTEKGTLSQRFYYQLNLNEIGLEPSDELEYYFEVWDNDRVHGSKSTRSKINSVKAMSVKELEQKSEAGSKELKEKMEEAIKDAKSLTREMKELEQKMLEKRELTWEEKKKLESLTERQRKLAEKIDKIKNEQKRLSEKEKEFQKQSEEILQKQQQVEKMFNEIMNDEMKKLIKQVEQMMQMQNKDLIKQEVEKMQLNNKDVEKELDRMLEHFKQLELEKKLEHVVDKLDKIKEKQDELAKKNQEVASDKNLSKEQKAEQNKEIQKQQENLKQEFKDLKQELKDIEKKNQELETPRDIENTDKEQEEVEEKMEESKQEMEKGDQKKAGEKQKQAADKMKEMSDKMKSKMQSEKDKQDEINAEALREILENTIQLSKDQEDLMQEFKYIGGYNPQFVEAGKEQKKIKDNARIIEDSLLALSKKVPEISTIINREISKLNDNLDRSIAGFGVRNFGEIRTRQQYAMTHANNLAVMLSEVLRQMQSEMNGKGSKQGGKPKKGKGQGGSSKKSMSSLKKMQEELNKQLREGLNKQQHKGEKHGGEQGMGSKEYARMAAQQMAIRQQMQKMLQEMGAKEKEGLGGNRHLQEMQRLMEQTEKELFNKKMSAEMIQRQQEILTRLLESEKAERKQEQEQKRESEQAKEKPQSIPPEFDKYIKQKGKEKELQQTIPAELQPYYKEKAKEYFNKIEK